MTGTPHMKEGSPPPAVQIRDAEEGLRRVVREVGELAAQDLDEPDFYQRLLDLIVKGLLARGAVVWNMETGVPRKVAALFRSEATPHEESDLSEADLQPHLHLLKTVVREGKPLLAPPETEDDSDTIHNPTPYLLVLAPVRAGEEVESVVEVYQRRNDSPQTRRGYVAFVSQMCQLAGEWARRRREAREARRKDLLARVNDFAQAVNESLDWRETTYTVCNEARRLLGCDRVSVAVRRGGRMRVEAVSGQDKIEGRSNMVAKLGRLATKAAATGEAVWVTEAEEDLPPQIEKPLHEYVEETYVKSLAIIPLHRPVKALPDAGNGQEQEAAQPRQGELTSVLICEQIEGAFSRQSIEPTIGLLEPHCSRAIANSLDHNSLFLLPVWRLLGKGVELFRGRRLVKTAAVIALLVAAALVLTLVPAPFDLEARGTLQPAERRDVRVAEEGVITKVNVANLDYVSKGQVLLEIHNPDLEIELADVRGRLDAARHEMEATTISRSEQLRLPIDQRDMLIERRKKAQQQLPYLEEQLKMLEERAARLHVVSPIDGQVVTWRAENELQNMYVRPGDRVLSIVDPRGEWELELAMPEGRVGHLQSAIAESPDGEPLDVSFILATDPSRTHQGKLKEVHQAHEVDEEEGHGVKLRVGELDESELGELRAGAEVIGEVHYGYRPLGYVWFHEAVEWVQRSWFYYF